MIKIIAEFDDNKVQNRFDTFDEVYDWLATVQLLYKKKDEKLIGFTGDKKEPEPEDEKEKE